MQRRGPLTVLGERLQSVRPPAFGGLLDLLENSQQYAEFLELVQEYLPEHLEEIKRLPDAAKRVNFFAETFQHMYFPLAWIFQDGVNDELSYSDLWDTTWGGGGIPIERQGIDYDDLHEIDHWGGGYLLMGSLIMAGEDMYDDDQGVADVWLEACVDRTHVTQETMRRLPGSGWGTGELERYLKGSMWEAAADFAKYLANSTGNAFLDTNNETGFSDGWDRETVDYLVQQWAGAQVHHDRVHNLSELLDNKPEAYSEMLDHIFEQQEEAQRTKTLLEVFTEDIDDDE